MTDTGYDFVAPDQLRVGLYVELELGWMAHPFPMGSFKISSERQIEAIRSLGLARVRFIPARSDPPPSSPAPWLEPPDTPRNGDAAEGPHGPDAPADAGRTHHLSLIAAQRASLEACDRSFGAAIRQYRSLVGRVASEPEQAAQQCAQMVAELVGDMLGHGESSIRLLSESTGDRAWMHPVNVTVLSLLLGRAMAMPAAELHELGLAAMLHDIGKTRLPDRIRWADANFSPAEYRMYQGHVADGVALATRMGLPDASLRAIAQHHEMVDGSGFPQQLGGESISPAGKVLALVNRYENMCNPLRPSAAVTPHEALAVIYAQCKGRFDVAALAAFIRMMGVYPPGSVVQLSDERYALVVSVNSARPLKPRVIVHDPSVPSQEAPIVELERLGAMGIRRSIRPDLLPRAAMEYLSPRTRICYFFERATDAGKIEATA